MLGPNSYFVERASFARLRELSVSYDAGAVFGLRDVEVGISARNVLTITGYRGFDPEIPLVGAQGVSAVDALSAPVLRTVTVSFEVRF